MFQVLNTNGTAELNLNKMSQNLLGSVAVDDIINEIVNASCIPNAPESYEQNLARRVWGQSNGQVLDSTNNRLWKANSQKQELAAAPYEGLLTNLQVEETESAPLMVAAEETENGLVQLKKYAETQNLEYRVLDNLGMNLVKFAMNSIVDACPKDGTVSEEIHGGWETGMAVVGNDGVRQAIKTGEITDRYFRNDENTFCHIRATNLKGVASEVEQVIELASARVHVFRNNPGTEVRVAVLSRDGSGCMITMDKEHLADVLEQIKKAN